jgi:hypothetical protein
MTSTTGAPEPADHDGDALPDSPDRDELEPLAATDHDDDPDDSDAQDYPDPAQVEDGAQDTGDDDAGRG